MNLRMFGKDDTDHLDDFLWFGLDERKEFTNVWEDDSDHLDECAKYG